MSVPSEGVWGYTWLALSLYLGCRGSSPGSDSQSRAQRGMELRTEECRTGRTKAHIFLRQSPCPQDGLQKDSYPCGAA